MASVQALSKSIKKAYRHLTRLNGWVRWAAIAVGATASTFAMYQTYIVDRHLIESRGLWDYMGVALFAIMWCAILWLAIASLRKSLAAR